MRIQVTCDTMNEADSLMNWIESQEIMTVEIGTEEGTDRDQVVVTIEPLFAPTTPVQAASTAQVWSRFVLQLLAQELCY